MKTIYTSLITLLLLFFGIGNTTAETPQEIISKYVQSQSQNLTAYDIESHFQTLMTDPTFCTPMAAENSASTQMGVAALDATHFVVVYGGSGGTKAVIGVVSGTTITSFGTAVQINTGGFGNLEVAALSSTLFVAAYEDSGKGSVIACTVASTTISPGTEVQFNSGNTTRVAVAALTSSLFVISYQDSGDSNKGHAVAGTVAGTMITVGNEANFASFTTTNFPSKLTSTDFVIAYKDNSLNHGRAIVGTIVGTTITFGSPSTFTTNVPQNEGLTCATLTPTKFVVAFQDVSDSNKGKAVIGEVSGTSVTGFGTIATFNSLSTFAPSVAELGTGEFSVCYRDQGNSNAATGQIGTVSGTTITFGNKVVIDGTGMDFRSSASALSASHFVFLYEATASPGAAMAVIGTNSAVVPVEWVDFRAKKSNENIELIWETASEINNEGFEIEHSMDGKEWMSIGYENGKNDFSNYYKFLHQNPEKGMNYYRLKQMDFDGRFEYSKVVSLDFPSFENLESLEIKILPNPIQNGEFSLTLPKDDFEKSELKIFNGLGNEVRSQSLFYNQNFIQIDDLPKGVYLIFVTMDNERFWERILVQ